GTLTASNYDFTFVNGTLTVGKATLTVTANDKTRTYGHSNPPFTATITGFKNGETVASSGVTGTPSCSSSADILSNVAGSPYTIHCTIGTLASGNYSFSFVDGTLSVTPASLTVTANAATKVYGSANPAFSVSYSGFVLSQDPSVLGGSLAFATAATASSG